MTRALYRTRIAVRRFVYRLGPLHTARMTILRSRRRWHRARAMPWRFAAFGRDAVIATPICVSAPDRIEIAGGVSIGRDARLSVTVTHTTREGAPMLRIGARSNFGARLVISCAGSIVIGEDVLAADNVFIADTYHEYRDVGRPILGQGMTEPQSVRIDDGVFLGVNAVVLPGTHIGRRAYIGASAVVTGDIPPLSIAVGNPARIVRRWDEETEQWVAVPAASGATSTEHQGGLAAE